MDLVDYIREHSQPLQPTSTDLPAQLRAIPGIRAVVFDIYGTVMISAAGDISLAGGEMAPAEAMRTALDAANVGAAIDGAEAYARYRELVAAYQAQRSEQGIEYPEVEIREVWADLIDGYCGDSSQVEKACVVYECQSNPVWPMPGVNDCLRGIRSLGLPMGIVSNAQFYTPLLFPALAEGRLEDLGFDARLMVYSYQEREGKPSRGLYRQLAGQLAETHDISPEETLYIGNDRLKDIWPAQLEGYRTVLFAGDGRSLRWREDDDRLVGVEPDAVITHLDQIATLLGG